MIPAIDIHEVTKVFRTYYQHPGGVKSLILNPRSLLHRGRKDTVLAIDRITMTVHKGETLGIVGRNGVGKSTLLALIVGIFKPTSGKISVRGRISPLLSLGVGFNYDLTGRDNIILNGVLLGLRRKEIEREVNNIIDFSGLFASIDQPLKYYSSGMQMRLGFSIAIHVQPEILLVDEVLAVGDAEFHGKCLERIGQLRKQGVTIVFVSHDLQTVEAICDRVAYIEKGKLFSIGWPVEVVKQYRREISHSSSLKEGTHDP